jgi:hypothetical protein
MDIVKTDVEGIVRDTKSKALLNTDNSALQAYKKIKKKSYEFEDMKKKVEGLDKEMSDIKNMLKQILEKL